MEHEKLDEIRRENEELAKANNLQEKIDKIIKNSEKETNRIIAEAKAKIDELVKLQKGEEWKPSKGEWCYFYGGGRSTVAQYAGNHEKPYHIDANGDYHYWDFCRKLKPEDVGFTQNKQSWADAPDWAWWIISHKGGREYFVDALDLNASKLEEMKEPVDR